jgi:glycine cleavage system H protein
VSGKIAKINPAVTKKPALVNQSPYEQGWLFVMEGINPQELEPLMSYANYQKFLEVETNGH